MTFNQMDKFIHNVILPEVLKTRTSGQKEYARDIDDVFHNFRRVASFTGDSEEKAILTYMVKHMDGVGSYINGYESQREDVTGRIKDLIVYLMLLWALIS